MLRPITAAKLDQGLAKLAMDQLEGTAPPPGQVSLADIARRAGLSEKCILDFERITLAKVYHALLQDPQLLSQLNIKP